MTWSEAPGLYLHIPFCSAICPYCDFYVLTGNPRHREDFVDRLIQEMALWAGAPWPAPFDTIYLGGGTPSALDPDQLARILDAARTHLDLAAEPWIQLEANPEDADPAHLAAWRHLGVRTLSLGVQSFDDARLRFLGRRHDAAAARRAVEAALAAGFDTVSADLIYALPGETPEGWARELRRAAELRLPHLSCYQLTIHEGTPFGFRRDRGQLTTLPDEAQADRFRFTHRYLGEQGLRGYEVSNFAVSPEHRSRHNRKYWKHVPYLGLGPSAHSYRGARRWWNERKLKGWRSAISEGRRPLAGHEDLTPSQLALEALMLGLRTYDGIDLDWIRQRWGVDLATANESMIEDASHRGWLQRDEARLTPTLDGLAICESLARGFELPAPT